MKAIKKTLALVLAVLMAFSCAVLPASAVAEETEQYASIVIPGLFQSKVRYYDEDGKEKLNENGQPYSGPFFMESTSDIVKLALKEALIPLGELLITQEDKEDKCAKAIAEVIGEALLGNIAMDSNGQPIKDIRADKYNTNLAKLSTADRNYAMQAIPLTGFATKAGYEKMYFFSYLSTGNIMELAQELYELIQTAKRESGLDKVNLAPISQGGTICNALVQLYLDKGLDISEDVNRICYVIPAADGSNLLGDIYRDGFLSDADALYGYIFPSLLGEANEYLAYLINILLRIFPEEDVKNILNTAVHYMIEEYLEYSTCLWALIPSTHYEACREMYLMDEEDAVIRAQADWYYNAQKNARKNVLDMEAKGVECFDIVNYNVPLYKICTSWNKVNADGIIHMDSESFGATSVNVDTALPEDYEQANTYCSDPEHHNHIDEARLVDASTGVLCDRTFYFKGQNHETTARNDVIMRLAVRILTDESFDSVYSDPAYPQFNYGRDSRAAINLYNAYKNYNTAKLDEDLAAEFIAARDDLGVAIDSTCMPKEEFAAKADRFETAVNAIKESQKTPEQKEEESQAAAEQSKKDLFLNIFSAILKFVSTLFLGLFGGKGFGDLIK